MTPARIAAAREWLAAMSPPAVFYVVAGFATRRRRVALDAMRAIHAGQAIELGPVVARAICEAHEAGRRMGTTSA